MRTRSCGGAVVTRFLRYDPDGGRATGVDQLIAVLVF